MATSINLRINDDLEKKLKEKVEEIKKDTPKGAEINNSTVVRGALLDFFEKLDSEKKGEKSISFNLKKLSDEEFRSVDSMIEKIIDNLDKEESGYSFVWFLLTNIATEILDELIERKKIKILRGEV